MNQKAKKGIRNEALKACINNLSHDGRGLAEYQQKKVFITGALPQEEVSFTIIKKHRSYYEAQVLEVFNAASERVTPPCTHFGICGGCQLQHMSMQFELNFKQQTLLTQLKHFGRVTPLKIFAPLTALDLGYRRKARLGVKFVIKKDKLLVGFRERASAYLAELKSCKVLHPKIGEHLETLSILIRSLEAYQHIPQIEVAMGDEEVALIFRHLTSLSLADQEKLIHFAKEHQFQIYLQPNSPAKIQKLWPQDQNHRLSYTLPDFNLQFLFHPLDFTQINLEMNRLMVKHAIDALDIQSTDNVLDLFCGIGNFSLALAKHAASVVGVEGSEEMVERATANAIHNNICNTRFYAHNLMSPELATNWLQNSYDKILLDPPRTGAKEILSYCAQTDAKKIVYVSCNPATLARDAGELVHQHGYQLSEIRMINMFPKTSHIEAIALFEKC